MMLAPPQFRPGVPPVAQSRAAREFAFLITIGVLLLSAVAAVRAQNVTQAGTIAFNIPAQPLASALEAYGTATGQQLFYDASLAAGHRSSAVEGVLTPADALARLLLGTGYVSRQLEPGVISIVYAPPVAPPPDPPTIDTHPYDPYFATIQARLSQALCGSDLAPPGSGQIVFKFWLSALGTITHAQVISQGDDPARNRALMAAIEGLSIGEAPPTAMPEPVFMAIYPPSAGDMQGCAGE